MMRSTGKSSGFSGAAGGMAIRRGRRLLAVGLGKFAEA